MRNTLFLYPVSYYGEDPIEYTNSMYSLPCILYYYMILIDKDISKVNLQGVVQIN